MIFGFTFFYTSIFLNPDDMAKNIQQQRRDPLGAPRQADGRLPQAHQRPPYALRRHLHGPAGHGATTFARSTSQSLPFGASSLMIAVSVIMEPSASWTTC
jgi:preprotein translocase subunit SecY